MIWADCYMAIDSCNSVHDDNYKDDINVLNLVAVIIIIINNNINITVLIIFVTIFIVLLSWIMCMFRRLISVNTLEILLKTKLYTHV